MKQSLRLIFCTISHKVGPRAVRQGAQVVAFIICGLSQPLVCMKADEAIVECKGEAQASVLMGEQERVLVREQAAVAGMAEVLDAALNDCFMREAPLSNDPVQAGVRFRTPALALIHDLRAATDTCMAGFELDWSHFECNRPLSDRDGDPEVTFKDNEAIVDDRAAQKLVSELRKYLMQIRDQYLKQLKEQGNEFCDVKDEEEWVDVDKSYKNILAAEHAHKQAIQHALKEFFATRKTPEGSRAIALSVSIDRALAQEQVRNTGTFMDSLAAGALVASNSLAAYVDPSMLVGILGWIYYQHPALAGSYILLRPHVLPRVFRFFAQALLCEEIQHPVVLDALVGALKGVFGL